MKQTVDARISLFTISRCGYYGFRKTDHKFCTLSETLTALDNWAKGKSLRQTKTFEVRDGEDLCPVYLFDIHQSGDNWLITTWNETNKFVGGVASVKGGSRVGAATVDLTDLDPDSIPGFPTYFFIVPSQNILASVRFSHAATGQAGLREYVRSYLELFSPYVVMGPDESGDAVVKGYRKSVTEVVSTSINPHFDTRELRNPGKLDEMRQNVHKIRKLTRKATLELNQPADLRLWQSMLARLNLSRHEGTGQKVSVKYDLTSTVTVDELNAMIEAWESSRARTWDDYGVFYKGGPNSPDWFSNSIAAGKFEVRVTYVSEAQIDSQSLLNALLKIRDEVLRMKQ